MSYSPQALRADLRSKKTEGTRDVTVSVGLFVTCLVDLVRPSVGFAAVKLLEASGVRVSVPLQTCCGQPAYNSGDRESARRIAAETIEAFSGFDYVVAPSGSCAAMLKLHYPRLFEGDEESRLKALAFADRVHELTDFLVRVRKFKVDGSLPPCRVAYHDSCSGLRELSLGGQARALLSGVQGLEIADIPEGQACCGFGGLFSVKYPDISDALVEKKVANILETGATVVTGGDLGCLMNIAGKLKREGHAVACRHVAEILAGDLETPALGEADRS